MDQPGVQQLFFQHIKNNLPPHLSLVDEIGERLNISNDSAYRRIRGEKPISFEEIQNLCTHYKISLDQFFHLKSDSFIFSGRLSHGSEGYFQAYLQNVLKNMSYLKGFEQKRLYFLTKDIPWISFFQVPELAFFKFFLWMRSILHIKELKSKRFSFKKDDFQEYLEIGRKIIQLYNQIPTTEIWNLEAIHSTIQQIEYYRESNLFESAEDALLLYEKLGDLIDHIERQAEAGKKFTIGEPLQANAADFQMFFNELALGDNTVLVDLGKTKITYLNHSVIDFVSTRDERFCNNMHENLLNLISKSTQISTVGEKSRNLFFNSMREKVDDRKKAIKHSSKMGID
jgi:hypothetical protein